MTRTLFVASLAMSLNFTYAHAVDLKAVKDAVTCSAPVGRQAKTG